MKKKVFIAFVLAMVVLFVVWYGYKERVKSAGVVPQRQELVGDRS